MRFAGKDWPTFTDAECAQSVKDNAERAEQMARAAREAYRRFAPGSAECRGAHEAMCRHESDARHWREMSEWYRKRAEADDNGT